VTAKAHRAVCEAIRAPVRRADGAVGQPLI